VIDVSDVPGPSPASKEMAMTQIPDSVSYVVVGAGIHGP